jgi:hypothetical protein
MLYKKNFLKKKKGVSIMIGYVLLIAAAIAMSFVIYQWLKTYVPADKPECPEGVSLYLSEYYYDCVAKTLQINLKNNGRFNISGYFIRASNDSNAPIATMDISGYHEEMDSGGTVVFKNSTGIAREDLSPEEENLEYFIFVDTDGNPVFEGNLSFIEITPVRLEKIGTKVVTQVCVNSKIREEINCDT